MDHIDDALDELIHRADLDGLVRMIDDRCSERDWAGLLRVRDRARHAVATGRQLWPAATLAEYRLALLASAEYVGAVLDETDGLSGRFTIGPLTEVAAQHHTWDDLAPVLDRSPRAAFVAHERVVRGDLVDDDDLPAVLDLPLSLQPWEPDYALATYTEVGAEFPAPPLPDDWEDVEPTPAEMLDDDVELAIRQLVEPWTTSSNGQVDVVCVDGDVAGALGALGLRRARVVELDPATALAWLAWAGASGGAHGRRRGAAAGRFGAWWTLAALGDLTDDWPVDPDELGDLAAELRWYRWDAHEPALGWQLQLAVEDPEESVAWAILARDAT
jgi:resuscitation-promoting factor RpfA